MIAYAVAAAWGGGKDLSPRSFNPLREHKSARTMADFFGSLRAGYEDKKRQEASANGDR